MKNIFYFILLFKSYTFLNAQGTLSGNFRLNADFYDRDSAIGAANIPNYDYNKSSANSWLQVNYTNPEWGFDASIRADLNYNSMLQNPPANITASGIGYWFLRKKVDDLEVTVGSIYEQYGTGSALRAFEDRSQGIDNSIFGAKIVYNFSESLRVRALAGVQKGIIQEGNIFNLTKPFVKAANIEYSKKIKEDFTVNLGASIVNRTLDVATRNAVNSSNDKIEPFSARYNTVVYQLYNTLSKGNITWYVEGAYKSPEAIFDPITLKYMQKGGSNLYTSLSYSIPKFGVTAQARRSDNFQFLSYTTLSSNFSENNNRSLAFITPINRQNSLRLPARFQIAPQAMGEMATSIDFTFSPFKKVAFNLSLCLIDSTNMSNPYYREVYFDVEFKKLMDGKMKAHFGAQYAYYNQLLYMREGEKDVKGYTFFAEASYKLNRKHSLRAELQYQHAEKELGQSIFALIEYNIAPKWSFSVTDLYNFNPNPNYFIQEYRTSHHFYSVFAAYTKDVTRITLGYVKQLQGIVCTGGVCRIEPAFSGIRMQLTTSF